MIYIQFFLFLHSIVKFILDKIIFFLVVALDEIHVLNAKGNGIGVERETEKEKGNAKDKLPHQLLLAVVHKVLITICCIETYIRYCVTWT